VAAFVQVTVVGDHDDGPVGRVGPGGHRRHQPPDPLVGGPDGGVVVRARTDQVARDVHRTEIDERCVRSVSLDDRYGLRGHGLVGDIPGGHAMPF
jgi:hypothetical protein